MQGQQGIAAEAPVERPYAIRNNWRDLTSPGTAQPPAHELPEHLTVSVVIPAYNCNATLPWTLAALAHQDYPAHLIEVVVADDGSAEPPVLPPLRPERTRIVRVDPEDDWGRASACHTGVLASEGEIVLFLDSDMVPFRDHVRTQARWHHLLTDAVTMGHKRFVTDWQRVSLQEAIHAAEQGTLAGLFPLESTSAHWVEQVIADSDDLHEKSHLAYRVFVGATGAMHRSLYDEAGGMDTGLRLGEDTELAYRLAQAGGVFIPETTSSSWHLGTPTVLVSGEQSRVWNRVHLANRMPYTRSLRGVSGRVWPVPLVQVVVDVADVAYVIARAGVDRLLAGDEEDLRVDLVAPWSTLPHGRRSVLNDPLADLAKLHEWFRAEPRVRLVEAAPISVFPTPFRLDLPATTGVGRGTVRRLVEQANKHSAGVVRVLLPGHAPDTSLRLVRTAARARALRTLGSEQDDALATVWGLRWLDGESLDLVDLRLAPAEELAATLWSRNTDKLERRITRLERRAEKTNAHQPSAPPPLLRRIARRAARSTRLS